MLASKLYLIRSLKLKRKIIFSLSIVELLLVIIASSATGWFTNEILSGGESNSMLNIPSQSQSRSEVNNLDKSIIRSNNNSDFTLKDNENIVEPDSKTERDFEELSQTQHFEETQVSEKGPVSSRHVVLDEKTINIISVEDEHAMLDNLLANEKVDAVWANKTENNINEIFQNSDNYQVLSENNLDFNESHCRSTVCSVSFTPTKEVAGMARISQLISMTSFFESNEDLDNAQMFTEYNDDGLLIIKLNFSDE